MTVRGRFLWFGLVIGCALLVDCGIGHAVADEPATSRDGDVQDLMYLAPKRPIVIRLHVRVDEQPLSELRAAIARAIFDSLDADSNGVLEGNELAGIPSAELLAIVTKRTEGRKPANDLNKQRVTAEELTAYLLPSIGTPFALVVQASAKPADKTVDPRLVAAGIYGSPGGDSLDMSSLLAILDANGDGRVTLDECSRVDELFRLLDLNDDETISRSELAEVAAAKNSSKGASTPLGGLASLLQPLDHQGTEAERARKMAEKYGRTSPLLAANRLGNPTPRCELDVVLAKKTLDRPSVALHPGSASDQDDSIDFRAGKADEVILRLGALPIILQAAESPPRPVSRTRYFKSLFKRADRDNNGYLDSTEFAGANPGMGPGEFKAADRDHNGMIFEDEWLAFMAAYQIVADYRVTLTIAGAASDPIAKFDVNGDGRLTHNEWARALAAVRSWDRNHDGEITPDEVPQRFVGTFHLGTLPSATQAMAPMRSMTSQPAAVPLDSSAPAWFQKMDRNRDGEVSLREFFGPISVFRRLDTNHDGYLDPEEARKSE